MEKVGNKFQTKDQHFMNRKMIGKLNSSTNIFNHSLNIAPVLFLKALYITTVTTNKNKKYIK